MQEQLLQQAFQARREHRLADAKLYLADAVDLARKGQAPGQLARALTGLGQIERDLHNRDTALEHYREAAAIYRAEGDALRLAHTVRHLGDIYQDQGRMKLAEPCYREALNIYCGDPHTSTLDLANAIRSLALLKAHTGATAQAAPLWGKARDLYAQVDVKEGVAECSRRLARDSQPNEF